MAPTIYSIDDWLEENKQFFKPPICNKLMYDSYLKCFFVGGPNSRKDFHLEEGEEFFYMLKGDMNLVVVEKGIFKYITIKEGQVFLLPSRIAHSPQRYENTCGLVIERRRLKEELDGLRYYVENSTEILYEKWFHCDSLDQQLPPLIKEYFQSEQFRTGKPIEGSLLENKPVKQDLNRVMDKPFFLKDWIQKNKDVLQIKGKKSLFEENYTSEILVLGRGIHVQNKLCSETFLWQIEGTTQLTYKDKKVELKSNFTVRMNEGDKWTLENSEDSFTLQVIMHNN